MLLSSVGVTLGEDSPQQELAKRTRQASFLSIQCVLAKYLYRKNKIIFE